MNYSKKQQIKRIVIFLASTVVKSEGLLYLAQNEHIFIERGQEGIMSMQDKSFSLKKEVQYLS